MKTVLAVAVVLALSPSAALADCAWHTNASAAADIDRTIVTASVRTTQKQERLPATEAPVLQRDGDTTPADAE